MEQIEFSLHQRDDSSDKGVSHSVNHCFSRKTNMVDVQVSISTVKTAHSKTSIYFPVHFFALATGRIPLQSA